MADSKEMLTTLSGVSTESEGVGPMPGDAVPEPLAFCALGQQHNKGTRRCHRCDGIAHATGLLRRSGCLPAEPYPPQQRIQATAEGLRKQETSWPPF